MCSLHARQLSVSLSFRVSNPFYRLKRFSKSPFFVFSFYSQLHFHSVPATTRQLGSVISRKTSSCRCSSALEDRKCGLGKRSFLVISAIFPSIFTEANYLVTVDATSTWSIIQQRIMLTSVLPTCTDSSFSKNYFRNLDNMIRTDSYACESCKLFPNGAEAGTWSRKSRVHVDDISLHPAVIAAFVLGRVYQT